ncbi:hypothetical protein BJV82DRAFT_691154 [Fennellomyces sp. T-0311]|nr:hypothetical protein BJV82DRAFT_691154 [Fennellomyces sp. T-0311]
MTEEYNTLVPAWKKQGDLSLDFQVAQLLPYKDPNRYLYLGKLYLLQAHCIPAIRAFSDGLRVIKSYSARYLLLQMLRAEAEARLDTRADFITHCPCDVLCDILSHLSKSQLALPYTGLSRALTLHERSRCSSALVGAENVVIASQYRLTDFGEVILGALHYVSETVTEFRLEYVRRIGYIGHPANITIMLKTSYRFEMSFPDLMTFTSIFRTQRYLQVKVSNA